MQTIVLDAFTCKVVAGTFLVYTFVDRHVHIAARKFALRLACSMDPCIVYFAIPSYIFFLSKYINKINNKKIFVLRQPVCLGRRQFRNGSFMLYIPGARRIFKIFKFATFLWTNICWASSLYLSPNARVPTSAS